MTSDLRGPALMRAVADAIEAHPEQYDQGLWSAVTHCGTAYCVGGWACTLVHGPKEWAAVESMARDLLQLPDDGAGILFHPMWEPAVGLTVPEALRAIAGGRSVESVTGGLWCDFCEEFHGHGDCWCEDDE